MVTLASRRPTESLKGTTVYHDHGTTKIVVRAVKISKRRSNGIHYETIGRWCPVCGFDLTDAGRQVQLEVLESVLRA